MSARPDALSLARVVALAAEVAMSAIVGVKLITSGATIPVLDGAVLVGLVGLTLADMVEALHEVPDDLDAPPGAAELARSHDVARLAWITLAMQGVCSWRVAHLQADAAPSMGVTLAVVALAGLALSLLDAWLPERRTEP